MNKKVFAGLLAVLLPVGLTTARAQTAATAAQPWGTWFIGTALLPGSPGHKWGGFAEVQARTNGVFKEYFYNELKAGASYDIDPAFTATVAAGRYATSDYQELSAGPLNVEKRLWEQLVLVQTTGRLRLEHRYRMEQRWFRFRDDSTAFRQRLRYRLNAFVPLNAKTITAGTAFLSAYDEIFLNPKGPVFERNRVYAGVGYQFDAHFVAQVGWVNQTNYNLPAFRQGQFVPQNSSAKNNVVFSLIYRLARPSAKDQPTPERLPSQPD